MIAFDELATNDRWERKRIDHGGWGKVPEQGMQL